MKFKEAGIIIGGKNGKQMVSSSSKSKERQSEDQGCRRAC